MSKTSAVPRNNLQRDRTKSFHEMLAPDPAGVQEAQVDILKVYDTDTIRSGGIPAELGLLLRNNPDKMFCLVQIRDEARTRLILPFRDSEEYVFMNYGNNVQLQGRPAKIVFTNRDVRSGYIVPGRPQRLPPRSLLEDTNIWDIGGIL